MKARFVRLDGTVYLHNCTGDVSVLSDTEIRAFLETYDSIEHYKKNGQMPVTVLSDNFDGDLLAYVDDSLRLIIEDGDFFRSLYSGERIFVSTDEFAKKHGKKRSIVLRMCQEGRISGAFSINRTWIIPADAPYPTLNKPGRK